MRAQGHGAVHALAVVLLLTSSAVVAAGQPTYAVTDLGTLGGPTAVAHGVNSAGQVVGEADTAAGIRHAFVWMNGSMQDLNAPAEPSVAYAINKSTQVVGSEGPVPQGPANGFLWTSAGGIQTLLGLPGAPYTIGLAINAPGQIAGISTTPNPYGRAVFWAAAGAAPQDIGGGGASSVSYGINTSGQVVGWSNNWNGHIAFLWTSATGLQSLGVLPGKNFSNALGINDVGQVVGESWVDGVGLDHAFLWTSSAGMQDLGTLGGDSSVADAINASGQVVGWAKTASTATHAFLWQNSAMIDLNTLISDPSWVLTEATAINDGGQIAGYGTHNGQTRAFLLTPGGTGTIQVTTNLSSATFTVAQVGGPATYTGSGTSATFTSAPAGQYSVTFNPVPGYITPSVPSQTLSAGGSISFSSVYQGVGTIIITTKVPGPSVPLPAATFKISPAIAGFPNSGPYPATAQNVPAGTYTVSFNSVPNFTAPSPSTQTVQPGGTITFTGLYQQIPNIGATGTPTNPAPSSNEPINTATGNYYTVHADLAVPSRGVPFTFRRFYNSQDSSSTSLGAGWTHSYNLRLTQDPSGMITIWEADGHPIIYAPMMAGGYTALTPGLFDKLSKNSDSTFTLTRHNQTQVNFFSSGTLTSFVDRNGNTQTLVYDGSGILVSVIDSSGHSFRFAHDASGRITSLTDPTGRSWQYSYDASSNLVSVQDAAGGITRYTYDANHRMLSATDPRGITYLQNVYDGIGRVITQTNARGFATNLAYGSPAPGTTTLTDPLGNAIQHVYDATLRLTSIIDARGGVISYTYDANNNRTSAVNPNGKKTSFAYDTQGNTTNITDPLGNNTAFSYDANNNLVGATSAKGNATAFTYDVKGNLTAIRDAHGNITSFSYDPSGLLLGKTDAHSPMT